MDGIRKALEILGYDSFRRGRMYPFQYVKHLQTKYVEYQYIHFYKVKSESSKNLYDVQILNNGEKIYGFSCTCEAFQRNRTCKHVAAAFISNIDEILSCEHVDSEIVSLNILKSYITKTENVIRQLLHLEVEFSIKDTISFRILMGENKLYSISSENKFLDFMDCFLEKEEYSFGKCFTYNPNKHFFSNKDMEILSFIMNSQKNHFPYNHTSLFSLSSREFEYFLEILKGKGFLIRNRGEVLEVFKGMPTHYILKEEDSKYHLMIDNFEQYQILDEECRYVMYEKNLYLLSLEERNYLIDLLKNKVQFLTFSKENLAIFNNGLFKKIKSNIMVDPTLNVVLPKKPEIKLYFDLLESELVCDLVFQYQGVDVSYFDTSNILRDNDTETQVVLELFEYGFIEKKKRFVLDHEEKMYTFIDQILPSLTGYSIFTSKKIDSTHIIKKISSSNQFHIGKEGILTYSFHMDEIDHSEFENIFKALRAKKKYYRLKNKNIVSLENQQLQDLDQFFKELELNPHDLLEEDIEIPKYRALYIDSLKNSKYGNIQTDSIFNEFVSNFKKYQDLKISFDEEDERILRDYQKWGVKWLTTIYKCQFGGILADEMGLGKSIQTISFIKQVLKEKKDAKILIVSPTSLIYNWQKEFEKFGSFLKYTVVAEAKGRREEILKNSSSYNIFITTYGLVRNDFSFYEDLFFELCVIDEAQAIKNYQAMMTREIKKIKANCKIALTGTPVENNVTELWSIFDFIMPGYLNSIFKFREKYLIKDVNEEDLNILKTLNEQISPFILRRKKKDVIKSLPEKLESKIYMELPKQQKLLYVKVLNDTKEEMDQLIREQGFQKSRVKVLQLLTKLRQLCIDPNVLFEEYTGESVKMEELLRIVKEYIATGHKILIFSSFKRVLENVKKLFQEHSISNYMIDGSVKSRDRMDMVESFNKDLTNCFLITLKAGGTGLNLVGADVVIHLDIWWNPQVENQATDRAHRIGQEKNVTVIKLITKGTIEEKIIELQEKKRVLSENLIEGKKEDTLMQLTEQDFQNLLSYSE